MSHGHSPPPKRLNERTPRKAEMKAMTTWMEASTNRSSDRANDMLARASGTPMTAAQMMKRSTVRAFMLRLPR
ncbi:hypothetical protein Henu3_gp27 [Mycobacterium phage Henu3 PeY-2017]|nr:hypothetical protein Henu3_gp27 [Mycobacterium phage Henu3 PeY-2017]